MAKLFSITLILIALLGGISAVRAQNPFISKDSTKQVSPAPCLPYPFLTRIAQWQHQLNRRMAALSRQAKETRSLRPLLSVIGIAFLYGVLHAAGPGHGKAVAVSYLVARGRKLGDGILLGNLIAFCHGISGIGLVLAIHFVLRSGITGPLENTTRTTQLISYGLIALLGGVILIRSLLLWRGQAGTEERKGYSLAMALAVGMIPCPGVVLVMLFSLSLSMVGLGLVLAFFQILGMGVTISALGVAALLGKNLALGVLERNRSLATFAQRGVETAAALCVTAFGLLFLAATI